MDSLVTTLCAWCSAPARTADDFCHECGHSLGFGADSAQVSPATDATGLECPICRTGEIAELSYGVRQCDSCGYTARDGAPR